MPEAPTTLNFRNLPLLRTEYSLVFAQPAAPSLDEIIRLREVLGADLPLVSDFSGGGTSFRITIGSQGGAAFDNLDEGVGLAIREDRVFVAWQRLQPDSEYVRFARLMDLLCRAFGVLDSRMPGRVVGSYSNLIPKEQGSIYDLVDATLFPNNPLTGDPGESTQTSWNLPDHEERLQIYPINEGYIFETGCIVPRIDNLPSALKDARGHLYRLFHSIITEKAKHVWQLDTQ